MRKSTRRERRHQIAIALILVGVVLVSALLFMLDPSLRAVTFNWIGRVAALPLVRLATGIVVVVVLAVLEIADHADRIKFLRETVYRLLGYDAETIAQREREFTDVPENYVPRPVLEKQLSGALTPSKRPAFVVLHGERDSGKTTLLHYVISRRLTSTYRGRVIYCRGDRHSIELEPDETDDHARRKLAKRVLMRVLDKAEVPGDVGEGMDAMSRAIDEHFRREGQPWLIVIDQVDDALFPYAEVLPSLYGRCNTVVVGCRYPAIDERATFQHGSGHKVVTANVPMQPLTPQQATELLRSELRKRRKRVSPAELRLLVPHLDGTSPGIIQRLSDAYTGDQSLPLVTNALDPSSHAGEEERIRAIAELTVEQFTPEQRRFVTALSILNGETVAAPALDFVARRVGSGPTASADLIQTCVRRGYLIPDNRFRLPRERQRYTITKLGRGIARVARRSGGTDEDLTAGAAVLDFYRGVEAGKEHLDLVKALPNIMSVMTWSQVPPRWLPETALISFCRMLKDVYYIAGTWTAGIRWLTAGLVAAERQGRPRSYGDLAAARAHLYLLQGMPRQALDDAAKAATAFATSQEQTESDLRLDIGDVADLRAGIQYDRLQRAWLTHLEARARILRLPSVTESAEVERISRCVRAGQSMLDAVRATPLRASDPLASLAHATALALEGDGVELVLVEGDRAAAAGASREARQLWRQTRERARALRRSAGDAHDRASLEACALAWRLEAAACRRFVAGQPLLMRSLWRRRGVRALRRSLRYCARMSSRYDEGLALRDIARLATAGTPEPRVSDPVRAEHARRPIVRWLLVRAAPRWRRYDGALHVLRAAHASNSTLGAQSAQVDVLVALADLMLRLWMLDRDSERITAARAYALSACSIVERLRSDTPELVEQLRGLPVWLLPPEGLPAADPSLADPIVARSTV